MAAINAIAGGVKVMMTLTAAFPRTLVTVSSVIQTSIRTVEAKSRTKANKKQIGKLCRLGVPYGRNFASDQRNETGYNNQGTADYQSYCRTHIQVGWP